MQTKKDHVHAYQALVGRMSAALLLGDTNYSEPPARRALLGLVLGLVLGLLAGIGFWVYGLMYPGGNTAWAKPNVIIVEKESGTRFVYRGGQLVPVLNHASAMLLQGAGAKIEMISRASLQDLPRAVTPIGVPNAPDPVPSPKSLVNTPWVSCLPPSELRDGVPSMSFDTGLPMTAFGNNEYIWVASKDGTEYIVRQSGKMKLASRTMTVALGLGAVNPPVAPEPWLAALPSGPELDAADIPDQNRKVEIGGVQRQVGTVFRQKVGNGTQNFTVLRADGLATLSATEAAFLQASTGKPAVELDAASIANAPRSRDTSLVGRIPDLMTAKAVPAGEKALCLKQESNGAGVRSTPVLVDRDRARPGVTLKGGTGVLAASVPAPAAPGVKPDRFLITDRGMKYALTDDDTVSALGFGGVSPRPVPRTVLDQIPDGPTLSRAAVGVSEKGRA
ncbi:type VII secretion protein EccB [Lentzea sp. NPDC004782]|uniref:type VII secretion protein EccB n=1 Tax=Lentzea sp. NPDC004782 TaxID=3154458 RepID=UPI0033BAE36F